MDHWRNRGGNCKNIQIQMTTSTRQSKNLWDAARTVLKMKFIVIQSYIRKQEKFQINNLALDIKQVEKEEQTELNLVERKKIIKVRAEIKRELKKKIATINETES